MSEVASFLKLKVHSVNGVEIALCADCEGHLGLDNRYYMLDFARLL